MTFNNIMRYTLAGGVLMAASGLSAQNYFDIAGEADKAMAEERWADAADLLKQALQLEPGNHTNVMLLSNLGIVQYNLGQDSAAVLTLTHAHNMVPKSVTVLDNRAQVLTAMGRDEEAYADYTRILELDSTRIEARFRHAMMAMRFGDFLTAEDDCGVLLRQAPNSDATNIAKASLLSLQEKWADALPYYTKLIDKTPTAEFYGARAVCYLMIDRLNEASADINSGLKLDPENPELYIYRGQLNKKRYRTDDARKDIEHANKLINSSR